MRCIWLLAILAGHANCSDVFGVSEDIVNEKGNLVGQFKALMRSYYGRMGLSQMADGAIDVIERSSMEINRSSRGFLFESRLRAVSRELSKALKVTQEAPSSIFYAPVHLMMLMMRMQVLSKVSRAKQRALVLFSDMDEALAIHSRSSAQVGFYLWFTGLVEFFGAINPGASASTNRARAILFIEQYSLQLVCRRPGWSRLRTYDGSRDLTYSPALQELENFISLGVPVEPAQRASALAVFRQFITLAEDMWTGSGDNAIRRRVCAGLDELAARTGNTKE